MCFAFLRDLQEKQRADERTRTADLTSSRLVATCSRRWLELVIRLPKLFALVSIPQLNRLYRRVTVRLSSNYFGQDLFGPAQSRIGSRETDGGEGEDDGMKDLPLRNTDAEQLAHM